MKIHSKNFCIVLILLLSYPLIAQDFQGKAYYFSKTAVDMSNFGRPGMSEDMKKQIAERMKNMFEKTFVLTFNQSESLYKEEEKLETPGAGTSRWGSMMGSATSGPQYKNIKNKLLLQEQELLGKQFLVKDSLSKFEWKMESETKQIGQYMCFKATANKTVDAESIYSFARPANTEQTETKATKEIQIVAWYTMQIPVSQGPGDYWGLPGLILEVSADKTIILCSKIIINPEEKESFKVPSKGKEISKVEYDEIAKKKMEEMRESFRSRGGPTGAGRRQ